MADAYVSLVMQCPNIGTDKLCGEYARKLAAARAGRSSLRHDKLRAIRLTHARSHGTHTVDQWLALCCEMSWCCAKCGDAIDGNPQKDHATPIYLGGSDGIDNIQPLCPDCNVRKGPESRNYVAEWREARP